MIVNARTVKTLQSTFVDSDLYTALLQEALVFTMNLWATALVLPTLLQEIKTTATGSHWSRLGYCRPQPTDPKRSRSDRQPHAGYHPRPGHQGRYKEGHFQIVHEGHCSRLRDIERFIPVSIKTPINPVEDVPKILLSAMAFASEENPSTLSLMVPLLFHGLDEKLINTKRHVAAVTANVASSLALQSPPDLSFPSSPQFGRNRDLHR